MDLKVYERTRYQNIYRHKKNKNYVISISKPVKTSISKIDNKKIFSIDEAIKIKENTIIKAQKATETLHKEDFDTLWDKYMFWCKSIDKKAFNTILKKEKIYNKFLKNKINKPPSKINKEYISKFIDDLETTDKQKNNVIKELKAFFNWCKNDDRQYILNNPLANVAKYRIAKPVMKFWTPEQLNKYLTTLIKDFENSDLKCKLKAKRIYTLTILGFSLGDRIGESRALSFNSIDREKSIMSILHSINYDTSSDDFISNTKTYESEREILITDKVINIIDDYRKFLEDEMKYVIKDSDLIFLNFETRRPLSDTTLRKDFNYYITKADVPKIRMYDLRHTYAATMMSEGKEAYLFSQRMGHKNIKTTINVYGHLSNETKKEVAKTTDKYF